jgi:uncharacterized protein (TIGR03083 family)
VSGTNVLPAIKAIERQTFTRLNEYLDRLDASGWVEQSYCTDWLVYQVVSHLGSGARIGRMRLEAWQGQRPPVARDDMQAVWAVFDALGPEAMHDAYAAAAAEYLAAIDALADEVGAKEVDGFAGKRPLYGYQVGRLWELSLHSWDVFVARDRQARLDLQAAELLAGQLQYCSATVDAKRAAELDSAVQFDVGRMSYVLDLRAERPRLQPGTSDDATLVIEGPAEEVVRFVGGRHFLPGSTPRLRAKRGDAQALNAVRRVFR